MVIQNLCSVVNTKKYTKRRSSVLEFYLIKTWGSRVHLTYYILWFSFLNKKFVHGYVGKMNTDFVPTCLLKGKTRSVNIAIKLPKWMLILEFLYNASLSISQFKVMSTLICPQENLSS